MSSLNISPQSLKDYVETQVQESGFSTPSEYIRSLVRDDQKRPGEKLEAMLLEGLQSGEPVKVTPEYWEKKRAALMARHKTSRRSTRTAKR